MSSLIKINLYNFNGKLESIKSKLKKLCKKGNSNSSNKDYKKAIECFYKVLKIDPKDINALYDKGIAIFLS